MLKKLLAKFKFRFLALAILFIVTAAFGFNHMRNNVVADSCGNAPITPAMNIWPLAWTSIDCHDLPLIEAKNLSAGSGRDSHYSLSQEEHNAGITVKSGDKVRVAVYFHNGASPDDQVAATAHNVVVATQIDSLSGTSHNVSGAIGLDNGTPAYSIDPTNGGDTKITSADPTTLSYVSGTTQMCIRDAAAQEYNLTSVGSCGDGQTLVALKDGIFNGGVNIGNVKACFPYSGLVIFTLQVTGNTPVDNSTNISVSKTVRNATAGETAFAKSTNAHNGDKVDFQIFVKNTGTNVAKNVKIVDPAVSGLTFSSGTNAVDGFTIGDIQPGQTYGPVNFSAIFNSSTTLTNNVIATAENAPAVTDSASVNPIAVVLTPHLTLTKNVRNVTTNGTFAKTATATQNDVVEYQVVIKNDGNGAANDLSFKDVTPNGITLNSGYNGPATRATLAPNETWTFTYQATVNVKTGSLVNTATVSSSNANSATDSATVNVNTTEATRSLTVVKQVRNLTQGGSSYVPNLNANNGDTLQYQIIVTNTGNSTLNNISLRDSLPGSLNLVHNSFGTNLNNGSTFNNISAQSVAAGQQFVINYNATVNLINPACGAVINTVTASADGVSSQNSSATVNVICAPQPGTLSIVKTVKNITQNTSFSKNVSANQGDKIAYEIKITSSNGAASNVTMFDSIPTYTNYVSGSAKLNGASFSDSFTSNNVNIGNLSSNQTATFYFEATVGSNLPGCQQTTITNTANASADRMSTISDSSTVFVNNSNGCVVAYPQMTISKLVKNSTQNNSFQKSTSANTGDTVAFQVTVINTGTATLNNAYATDLLPNGLSLVAGTVRLDNNNASDQFINNRLSLGNFNAGAQHVITFDAKVNATTAATLVNTAQSAADNFGTIQDSASVFVSQVQGANVVLSYAKRAFNDTKNIDATSAPSNREDYITYTLTVGNTGNSPATNFIVSDDLSNVLNYASIVDLNGATMNGNVIAWPAETVNSGASVTHTFRVRVKYNLPAGSLQMVNTYGNTVVVRIVQPKVLGAIFVAPKTGATATVGLIFAALITLFYAVMQKKNLIPKVRFE
ncbi:MAG: hypothetical protein NVS3B9_1620 [Candidatus Doudnabacteria bacterium]